VSKQHRSGHRHRNHDHRTDPSCHRKRLSERCARDVEQRSAVTYRELSGHRDRAAERTQHGICRLDWDIGWNGAGHMVAIHERADAAQWA
jgi:hypothetical protein